MQKDRQYIINNNGYLFPVFKNPTDDQYLLICDSFNEKYPFCPSGEPKTRHTFDKQGNEYYWMSGDAMHYTVENYLLKHGIECNQNKYFDDVA